MAATNHRLALLFLLFVPSLVQAEQLSQNPSGEASFRGNYWRDRNTRVMNPTVDVRQELQNGLAVGGHYLLDAITSASVAAGASTDKPFTEMRHEAGLNVAVPLRSKHTLAVNYSYSTESDYWSHSAGLRLGLRLFQDNTALQFGADYGHNTVGKRLGPTGYLLMGVMQSAHLVGLWTQVLSRRALITTSYELTVLSGYQNNPYRPIAVAGPSGALERREFEQLPTLRIRQVLAAVGHILIPTDLTTIPFVTVRPGMRVHLDSWGLKAFNPELATHVPVGPTELRLLLGFYDQYPVSFYRADGGSRSGYIPDTPSYDNGAVEWGTRFDPATQQDVTNYVYTSDVKLGRYSTYTWELSLKWKQSWLRRWGSVGSRLSGSIVELSGGMWFADRAVGWQFGIPLSAGDPLAPAGCSSACGAGFASLGLYVPL